MTDSEKELVTALKAIDHMSVEYCFLQSPMFKKAAAMRAARDEVSRG